MTTSLQAIMIICVLTFARGVMWPAANVLFVANLPPAKHDSAFISSAFGSRLGDVIGPLLVVFSLSVLALSWRLSVFVVLVAVMFSFATAYLALPQQLKEPEVREHFSFEGLVQKMARIVTDVDGWLVFVSNFGPYGVWALYDYAPVLQADTYHLTPGQASGSNAFMSLGSAVGLAVAFYVSNILGTTGGRIVHVLQSTTTVVALCLLAAVPVSLEVSRVLLFLVGFGFVAMSYVPFMIYAARSRSDERAFRTAMIDGVSQMFSISFSYVYGTLRAEQGERGVSMIFMIAAAFMAVATVTMTLYYRRLHRQEAQLEQAPAKDP